MVKLSKLEIYIEKSVPTLKLHNFHMVHIHNI